MTQAYLKLFLIEHRFTVHDLYGASRHGVARVEASDGQVVQDVQLWVTQAYWTDVVVLPHEGVVGSRIVGVVEVAVSQDLACYADQSTEVVQLHGLDVFEVLLRVYGV